MQRSPQRCQSQLFSEGVVEVSLSLSLRTSEVQLKCASSSLSRQPVLSRRRGRTNAGRGGRRVRQEFPRPPQCLGRSAYLRQQGGTACRAGGPKEAATRVP